MMNDEIDELITMKKTAEKNLHELIEDEIATVRKRLKAVENDLIHDVVAGDEMDVHDAILEITAGIGGQEAMLFAGEMFNVYNCYAQFRGWRFDVTDKLLSDLGGLKKASVEVEGDSCYQHLRHEAGIHRVQRIPLTEKSGRMHTSTITVAVLPLRVKELNVEIPKNDLKIEATTSTGAGGQHVNKTQSCIRITHIPTGIVVECQEERFQNLNKDKAMQKLRRILMKKKAEEQQTKVSNMRRAQILNADRSDKIRTYNFQQDRITDHRLSDNINNIKSFMNGDPEKLHELLNDLENSYRKRLYQNLTE
ncbi:peptide chain release factor 1-like: mitochondrial isoform X2 [Leptotrombidium deliense]|uniref:Peptide chain release factor 1-like: mitochondrial isoform X2 n=1 Tax=Leptotrombidium deliense TaxID=299467 RepID=A0A443S763_9ACAR|nr:peptide chain release factor 1-like: mitochondrial isoform X2 [Leptotrombidium deliense]